MLIEYMYQERREKEDFASIDASIQPLEDYIKKHGEGLTTATRNDTDNTKANRTTITRKNGKKNNSMGVLNS